MQSPKPKVQGHNIVLIGNFNPKIFQPAWFGAEGLLSKQETEKANIQIIHPDVVIFSIEELLKLEVTRERFVLSTTQEPYDEVIRDLALGTFRLLRHTPIIKMGINRDMHFQIESEKKWHEIGHKLAPKELWRDILENPGMRTLTMEESKRRDDGLKGYIRVKIEPSNKVYLGVFFSINDHFETQEPSSTVGSDEIIDILSSSWEKSCKRSKSIIYSLLGKLL